jgi:DNA polymerase III epsilon subunit-like protein
MDRRYKIIYEDNYLPILECRRCHFYELEIRKLKRKFVKQQRRIRWEKCAEYVKKRNVKRMKERLNFQRSIYRHQFCQDNKLIFPRKV